MITKKSTDTRYQGAITRLDDLVPEEHLVRAIDAALDFEFIREYSRELYSLDRGRPGIDPVVLFKICFIQYIFGIPSMRQTIGEIEVNVAYRWFLGYDFSEKIPHFSTFSKNYTRRFKNSRMFEQIFQKILLEAVGHGFIRAEEIFIDSTHVKASANKNKTFKESVKKEARYYEAELKKEIRADRESHGKKNLKEKEDDKDRTVTKSSSDPEAGLFCKGEKERCFAYSVHTACDCNGFVLQASTTPGNVHDSIAFPEIYRQVTEIFPEAEKIVMDAGYKTPAICREIILDNRIPVLPYTRPKGQEGFFSRKEFVYDEYYDCIICPADQVLNYRTTNREGYKEYYSNPAICSRCPYLNKCTKSKENRRLIQRHIWEEYLEQAEHLRYVIGMREVYKKRKETIERVFADGKEKHGMRYTHYRGLKRVSDENILTYACMNLKKMARWLKKKSGDIPPFLQHIFNMPDFFLKRGLCAA